MNFKRRVIFVLFLIFTAIFVFPQEKKARGDYLTIKIAVVGPGTALYFWWGHLGLIVEDTLTGESNFYDYGVFSFNNDRFFQNFAMGRLIYSSTVNPTSLVLRNYIKDNRDVTIYTLDLDAVQKEEIREFAEWNARPEHRDYLYNHFNDNCVTRVLNILDKALDGQFYEMAENTAGRMTLRDHVRRHTWFSPFWDWFLNFLMGQGIDGAITVQEEMFLPSETGKQIEKFEYKDSQGNLRKLTANIEVVNRSEGRPAVLENATVVWPKALCIGTFIAVLLLFFKVISRRYKALGRKLLGVSIGAMGLFFGLSGALLFFLTFFSNHDYAWHNSNVIFVNPILLFAIPLGLIIAFSKNTKRRVFCSVANKGLWTYVLLGGILSMLIKLSPSYYQQNQVTLALILPPAVALSFIPRCVTTIFKKFSPILKKK